MNSSELLIMLIVTIFVAGIGVYMYTEVIHETQTAVNGAEFEQENILLVGVTGTNISNNTFKHIQISITSDGPIQLDETLITLRTNEEIAHLTHRNGDLIRDEATGFYTK